MAAASADRDAKRSDGLLKRHPVAETTTLYKGTLVGTDAAGYLANMAHGTNNLKFAGVTFEAANNAAGSNGDKFCRVQNEGEYEFVYNGGDATQALVGKVVYAVDNQTVDEDASVTTYDYPVGKIVEVISATVVRVNIKGFVDLTQTIVTANLAANILSADAAGRGKVATGFFDAATALLKFAARSIARSLIALETVEAHTAGDTLTAAESDSIHSNTGAEAAVTLVLPAAVAGLTYTFWVGAAQELRIDPNGTNTIALPSTGAQCDAGKYIVADAAGEFVVVKCITAGAWEVLAYRGTWTAES